jgi:hypothetical protein
MARFTGSFLTIALVSAFAASSSAQAPRAPKTPWGDPDISGTYNNSNESGIPMQRPAELAGKRLEEVTPAELAKLLDRRHQQTERIAATIGGTSENDTGAGPSHWYENYNAKNSRAWMISDPPDGQMPALTPAALARAAAARAARRGGDGYYIGPFDGPEDLTLYVRCISRGIPGSMMPAIYGNSYRIVASKDSVAITYEMVHETRIIPLDDVSRRPHISSKLHVYTGDARGHFEGETLVVETTNFLEKAAYGGASDQLKTIERFKLLPNRNIDWSITFDDANTWARPWTFGMLLTRDDSQPVFEYACHEGNEGIQGILKAARIAEKEAANGKPVD